MFTSANAARTLTLRNMGKEAFPQILRRCGQIFSPIVLLYSWWVPFRRGVSNIVLLPDSMAVFLVAIGGMSFAPYLGWRYVLAFCAALPLLPLIFLTVLLITEDRIRVFRLFFFIPYWLHRLPEDVRFECYEAWEDPAPSGVAFTSDSGDLHLGTTTSAYSLFEYVGTVLQQENWKQTSLGWERP